MKFKTVLLLGLAPIFVPLMHAEKNSIQTWKINHSAHSMLGTLPMDEVQVQPQSFYVVGDIVVFKQWDKYVIHRVTATKLGFIFTKGDFNRQPDGWSSIEDIVGKVLLPKPKTK